MNKLEFKDIHDRHIGRSIRMQAEQNGDTRFLVFDRTVYTFHETNEKVNELAAGLRRLGIGRGDRVVFYMSSAPEVMFLVLAVNKLGAVWVPVNSDYKGAWLEDTINRGRAKLLVTDTSHAERIAAVASGLNVERIAVLGDHACLPGALGFGELYAPSAGEPRSWSPNTWRGHWMNFALTWFRSTRRVLRELGARTVHSYRVNCRRR